MQLVKDDFIFSRVVKNFTWGMDYTREHPVSSMIQIALILFGILSVAPCQTRRDFLEDYTMSALTKQWSCFSHWK